MVLFLYIYYTFSIYYVSYTIVFILGYKFLPFPVLYDLLKMIPPKKLRGLLGQRCLVALLFLPSFATSV